MKNEAEQREYCRHIGADACTVAPKPDHSSYTYQAANGCEVTVCFSENANEGLVPTVLEMLLQDAYREE